MATLSHGLIAHSPCAYTYTRPSAFYSSFTTLIQSTEKRFDLKRRQKKLTWRLQCFSPTLRTEKSVRPSSNATNYVNDVEDARKKGNALLKIEQKQNKFYPRSSKMLKSLIKYKR